MGDRIHLCFCEESLGKTNAVLEFYRLKALITLEQVNASEVEKKENRNEQSLLVGCCSLSLHANESCDEHAAYFRH